MWTAEVIGIALGLALALGIFAFKTAVGAYYFGAVHRSSGRRLGFAGAMAGLYLALFVAAFVILEKFDLFRFAGDSMKFLRTGVVLHLVLAAGLLVWGIRLLSRRDGECLGRADAAGWLLLAAPCPVCASAIFLVCAFARMLFPESEAVLRIVAPLFFLLANLVFLAGLWLAGKFFALRPLDLAGRMMVFTALYFLLILLVAPQFQEAGKLYAAAAATRQTGPAPERVGAVALFAGTAVAAGFLLQNRKRKRCR